MNKEINKIPCNCVVAVTGDVNLQFEYFSKFRQINTCKNMFLTSLNLPEEEESEAEISQFLVPHLGQVPKIIEGKSNFHLTFSAS